MDKLEKAILETKKRELISKIMYWEAQEKKARKYIIQYSEDYIEIKQKLTKKGQTNEQDNKNTALHK